MRRLRVAFIGWGAINRRVGALLAARSPFVDIVGVAARSRPSLEGPVFLDDPETLASVRPDLVVEAAGREAVETWGPPALRSARALVVASTSAFCDEGLLTRMIELAELHGSRILIPPGAIGGVDVLSAAAILGLDRVLHTISKPPLAWQGTQAEQLLDLHALTGRRTFFLGTAREAASRFPQNANATVVTALAGFGLDRTQVELVADPALTMNGHCIEADGHFGRMRITLENNPLDTNPKSSELTALSLVRLVENELRPLVR